MAITQKAMTRNEGKTMAMLGLEKVTASDACGALSSSDAAGASVKTSECENTPTSDMSIFSQKLSGSALCAT